MLNKIKQCFNDFNIKKKLIVLLIIAAIVPLLFVSLYNYQVTRHNLIRQAYENVTTASQQIASNINDHFTSILQTAYVLSEDFILKSYLSKEYTSDYDFVDAYRYINYSFYNILSSNTKINNICIYTGNATLPSDGLFIKKIEESNEQEFSWIQNSSSQGTNVAFRGVHQTQKGEYVISLGSLFLLENPKKSHEYLVIDVKESSLSSLFAKEGNGHMVFVVDNNGYIQSTQDKALLAQPITDILMLDSLPEENNTSIQKVNDKKAMLVNTNLLNGWSVIIVAPIENIIKGANQTARQTLIVSMLCVGIAFLLILRISRYFSSRFALVNQMILQIEKNDFNVENVTNSKDEMGQMLSAFYKMAHNLENAINENYIKEMQHKDAELTLLQSQINPHLLYNALSGIYSLSLSGKNKEAADFTKHLSQFYKTSLNQGKRLITIAEEIAITKHYIAIQTTRFKDMFHFEWEIDESILEKETLKLVIQPFIENIVNHGVKDDTTVLQVKISVFCENENIVFLVEDSGIGMSAEKAATLLDPQYAVGYGILNVNERIKLQYGSNFGVSIQSALNKGTTVTIKIPQ